MNEGDRGLLVNLVGLARTLRSPRMRVGPGAVPDAVHAVASVGIRRRGDFPGTLLKYPDDIARIRGSEAALLLAQVQTELVSGQRGRG